MNLNWKLNKETNVLTIELEGRLSSTNAQEVEEALMQIYNQNIFYPFVASYYNNLCDVLLFFSINRIPRTRQERE